jgi:5-(carboxyamino)imidazole ribonucleotide synthase
MAPRVHNTGHWTIEGAKTSQFENHVRAICGLPLGSTQAIGYSLMLNMLSEIIDPRLGAEFPGVYYHHYGKQPRPNRKLGHITLVDTDFRQYEKIKARLLYR